MKVVIICKDQGIPIPDVGNAPAIHVMEFAQALSQYAQVRILCSNKTIKNGVYKSIHITEIKPIRSIKKAVYKLLKSVRILHCVRGHGFIISGKSVKDKKTGSARFLAEVNSSNFRDGTVDFLEYCLQFLETIDNLIHTFRFRKMSHNIIAKWEPDLIYERFSFYGNVGDMISRKLDIPLILEVNRTIQAYTNAQRGKLFPIFLLKYLEKTALKNADAIAAVCRELKEEIQTDFPAKRVVVTTNKVNLKKFDPSIDSKQLKQRLRLDGQIIIGYLGKITHHHGVDLLLSSFMNFLHLKNISLLIVGSGVLAKKVSKAIDQIRREHGTNRAIFINGVVHSDVPKFLQVADILVAPYNEKDFYGSPMKIFEYMAMAKPIVASRVGQIARSWKSALLVEAGNKEQLIEALKVLIDDKRLREDLGFNARKIVEDGYSWDANAKAVIKLYRM